MLIFCERIDEGEPRGIDFALRTLVIMFVRSCCALFREHALNAEWSFKQPTITIIKFAVTVIQLIDLNWWQQIGLFFCWLRIYSLAVSRRTESQCWYSYQNIETNIKPFDRSSATTYQLMIIHQTAFQVVLVMTFLDSGEEKFCFFITSGWAFHSFHSVLQGSI